MSKFENQFEEWLEQVQRPYEALCPDLPVWQAETREIRDHIWAAIETGKPVHFKTLTPGRAYLSLNRVKDFYADKGRL